MPQYVDDGNVAFTGGQNDGLVADRLQEDQYEKGVNVTTKNGTLSPRPGFVHKEISVVTPGSINGRSYQKIFNFGKFQAAASYDTDSGEYIMTVISGIIFRVDPRNNEAVVVQVEGGDDRMSQYRRRINWSYAGRFLVFYDFPDYPIVIDDLEARRANPEDFEIPPSNLGAYVQNRLWVASAGHEFTAGDPVGGINGDAPITFEEVLAPAAAYIGQVFSLGSQSANQEITSMGFVQVADTSTGMGPLFVATKNSVYLYQANLPRSQWEQSSFGRLALYNAGIAGSRSFVNKNSDLIFLSGDNQVRSLLIGRSQQERWENAPISREVSGWMEEYEDRDLLDLSTMSTRENRVLIPIAPYRTNATSLGGRKVFDFAHGGMVVLELDNASALGQSAIPAWAGLWTGISPMEIVDLNEGLYIFSKDDGGVNRLYFVDESISWDVFKGEEVDIVSRVYTREYVSRTPFQDKKHVNANYSVTDVSGDFKLVSEYRPGQSGNWSLWGCFEHLAQIEICDADEECGEGQCELPILNTHAFRELDLGDPVEKNCDPLTGEMSDVARKLQLRLTLKGRSWTLRDIHIRSELEVETGRPATLKCSNIKTKKVCGECEPNDWEIHRTATRGAEWPQNNLTI